MSVPAYPSVGFFRLPRTIIELRGADRAAFLHNLCTNDVKSMQVGDVCEAFVTDVQGKVLGHVLIANDAADALFVSTVADQGVKLTSHFDRYLITEDVQMTDQSASWGQVAVTGSGAGQLVTELGAEVKGPRHATIQLRGRPVTLTAAPFTLPDCWLIGCESEYQDTVLAHLAELGGTGILADQFDVLRVEAGFPWYGIDFDETNLPQEIGRDDRAISFSKGCYLGQETVARIDALGRVNRHVVGLRSEGQQEIEQGDILRDGKAIGRITSSVFSPLLGHAIALGTVRREFCEPGTVLDTDRSISVVALPFV